MKKTLFISFFFISIASFAQKKTLQTQFTSETITIDGKLNEAIWNSTKVASDFVMFQPDNGKPIAENKKTDVRILYNNDAIYVAALLYDNEPTKILKEITERDDFGTSDFFGVFINGFNDGQQDFQFFVSAADGQADCITTDTNGEDYSWDAIWDSKATITSFGWVVEMKIPYAALRFSGENKQTWGINFFREIKRDRQKYTWSFIDAKLGTFTQQAGILEGIENIKPPTRLFLLPYSSFYINANEQQKTKGTFKGGMDIKYGINDAFTLDAILVPDFGQTKYDDQILNLSPFEQQFDENRPFFTEGTDLFNKGNLLYSRRIGGNPIIRVATNENEKVTDNPASVSLINAFKISGRTKNGLGIGILNAVTETTVATITNTTTNETRKQIVSPLTNYNVLVFDQRFNKNSSVALINTNVTRNGNYRDGNVSALVWDLNSKKNTFAISGDFKYSIINELEDKTGINSQLNFQKTSGKYRYGVGADITTKDYDIDDLGINNETNFYSLYGNASFRILNPTKNFNSFNTNFNAYTEFQKVTGKLQTNNLNVNVNINDKDNNYIGFGLNANPLESYDFYESRTENRYFIIPSRFGGRFDVSSNYNYKFALDFNSSFANFDEKGRTNYAFSVGPRYRFNDKFSVYYAFSFLQQNNNKGFVDKIDEDMNAATQNTIIFANRNVMTNSNTLSSKYSLSSRMNFNLSIRHYWSFTENKNFLSLEQNGTLKDYLNYNEDKNKNFHSWNLDVSYSWWFAPGSQLSILYRNNSSNFEDNLRTIDKDFGRKVTNLINDKELNHIFSISVRYFIDYNRAKNWL